MGKMGFNVSPESFKPNPYVSLNVFKPSAPIKVNKDFKHEQFAKGMITQKEGLNNENLFIMSISWQMQSCWEVFKSTKRQ